MSKETLKEKMEQTKDSYSITFGKNSVVFQPDLEIEGDRENAFINYKDSGDADVFSIPDESVEDFIQLFEGIYEEFQQIVEIMKNTATNDSENS